jgi:hypothetical protein
VKQNQLITGSEIRFTISDNLSGIVSYKGFLDGKWILMEYDPKMIGSPVTWMQQLAKGEHSLEGDGNRRCEE